MYATLSTASLRVMLASPALHSVRLVLHQAPILSSNLCDQWLDALSGVLESGASLIRNIELKCTAGASREGWQRFFDALARSSSAAAAAPALYALDLGDRSLTHAVIEPLCLCLCATTQSVLRALVIDFMLFDELDRSRLVDAIGQCRTLSDVQLPLILTRWSSPGRRSDGHVATDLLVRLFQTGGAANWTSLSLNGAALTLSLGANMFAALCTNLSNKRLVHLSLSQTSLSAAAAIASLCSFVASPTCTLQSLLVDACAIDDSGAIALASALTANRSLRVLDVSSNRIESSAVYCALVRAGAWKLHEFYLGGNVGRGAQPFACPTWAEVFNAQSSNSSLVCPPLRVLDVTFCMYDAETLNGMFAALAHSRVLECLRMTGTMLLDFNGYTALMHSAARAPALRRLSYGGGLAGITSDQYECLAAQVPAMIEESGTLAELEISFMDFTSAALRNFYRAITAFRCPSLHRFELRHCSLVHSATEGGGRSPLFTDLAFRRALAVTAAVVRIVNAATPDLGDGQQTDSGGDLAALPNELLCIVAARLWPTRSLLQLGWTCRLLRDCSLNNYVAHQRYGVGYGDWRQHYRAAWLDDDRTAEVVPLELQQQHFA